MQAKVKAFSTGTAFVTGCLGASVLSICLLMVLVGVGVSSGVLKVSLWNATPTTVNPLLIQTSTTRIETPIQPLPSSAPKANGANATLTPTSTFAARSLLCTGTQSPFVLDRQVRQRVVSPEPAPRTPFRDPVFGTCLVRVTDRSRDLAGSNQTVGMKNEYSRVQSFNAGGTRLIARSTDARWYLYDAATLQPLGEMPLEFDPRWDATNPNIVYYSAWGDDSNAPRLMAYNTASKTTTVIHDFGPDFPGQKLGAVWTRYEGSPSADGRYWGLQVEDADWHRIALIVYDQKEDRVVAKRDLRGAPGANEVDHTSISPLANFVISDLSDAACERGTLGTDAKPCGVMVYDRNLRNGRGLLRIMGHSDFALAAEGREVLVFQDIDNDTISMVDLATGKVTSLFSIDFSKSALGFHISGRGLQRPGWVLVSTYNGSNPTSATWMDDQILAVELKPGGRIVRLTHTHSVWQDGEVVYGEKDYWAEPHVSANPELTRILFTSNWDRPGTEGVEMYMIQLPPDWTDRLP